MKPLIITFTVCLLAAIGINQEITRNRTAADLAYQLQSESYTEATTEDEAWIIESITAPKKYYNIPLSADIQQFIFDNCRSLDPRLIIAVMFCESNFNPNVSNGEDFGLMGIRKKFAAERMERLGCGDLMNPYDNILVGIDILSEHIEKYGLHRGLIAYNCGEYSKVMRYTSTAYSRKVVQYMEGL